MTRAGAFLLAVLVSAAAAAAPDEFRGAWVATVQNLDWPSKPGLPTPQQQQELLAILDLLHATRLNALVFQIRPHGDAFYASPIEPWSRYLTGQEGQPPAPLWDPLAFAVQAAHARGLEVHAWFNPYRASVGTNRSQLAPNHMCVELAADCHDWGDYLWMDPGSPPVQDRAVAVVRDVVRRYGVDGIHFDDYFYPYPKDSGETAESFPDNATYAAYVATNPAPLLARDDWRRDNVNRLIARVAAAVKDVNPRVKFGVSPFGIYRPGQPEGVKGFDPYTELFCDAALWLRRAYVDYLAPQLYWPISPPAQSYTALLQWWVDPQQNPQQRHVYPGNAAYRIADPGFSVQELANQVAFTRGLRGQLALGDVWFSMTQLMQNAAGLTDFLRTALYNETAAVPTMPWLPQRP